MHCIRSQNIFRHKKNVSVLIWMHSVINLSCVRYKQNNEKVIYAMDKKYDLQLLINNYFIVIVNWFIVNFTLKV